MILGLHPLPKMTLPFSHVLPSLSFQQMSTLLPVQFYNNEYNNRAQLVLSSGRVLFKVAQCMLSQGHSKTWMFHTINPRPLIRSFVERSNNDDNSSEKYKTQTMIRFRELWSDPGGGWGQKATSFIPKTLSEGGRIWPTPIRARPRSHLKRWLPSAMPSTSVCFSDLGKTWKLNVIGCWND